MTFFQRRKAKTADSLRLYYASDIHGTEVLWRKFLNAPRYNKTQILEMGGDIAGKLVITLVQGDDGVYRSQFGLSA